MELSILDDLRPSKDQYAEENILDLQIGRSYYDLTSMKTEENRLQLDLQKQQKNLEKKKNEYNSLKSDVEELKVKENFNPNKGTFFNRLRSYEAELERVNSEIQLLESSITRMKDLINGEGARKKKLVKKIDEIQEKVDTENERTKHYIAKLNEANEQHVELTQNVEELGNECELIKERIKKKAEEIKKYSPHDAAMITVQKKSLEDEIREKQNRLESLKKQEKQIKARSAISSKRRIRDLKSKSSTSNWLSERMSYIARIKKAKEEISSLQKFERSNVRLSEITEKQKEDFNFTEDELKLAILAEAKSKEFHTSAFYDETVETELEFREELMQQLEEINQSMAQIQDFKGSTLDLLKKQEEMAVMNDRMDILRDELTDIRSELM